MKRLPGFSLVEVVIASALVVSAIGALFAIASMTNRLTIVGQDRFIAAELAREGVEMTRALRDGRFVDVPSACDKECDQWWASLHNPAQPAGLYTIVKDETKGFLLQPPADATGGRVCHGETVVRPLKVGSQTFCRRIFLEPVNLDTPTPSVALRVRSQVAWLGFGRNQFRHFSQSNLGAENRCASPSSATEWCSEQITLLTDWRQPL